MGMNFRAHPGPDVFRNNMKNICNKHQGLTLIELLIVIAIIGILSGITVAVINPTKQKDTARDGVKISNLQNAAMAIESYFAGEGTYPTNNSGVPAGAMLSTYLTSWPGSEYRYYTMREGNIDFFCVGVANSNGRVYKLVSPHNAAFTGGKPECGGVVLDCPAAATCNGTATGNDLGAGGQVCNLVSTGASCL